MYYNNYGVSSQVYVCECLLSLYLYIHKHTYVCNTY